MHPPRVVLVALAATTAVLASGAVGCGSSSSRSGYDTTDPTKADPTPTPTPTPTGNFNNGNPPAMPPAAEVNDVYGHSADTLFRLDPKTNAVTEIGKFSGCGPVIDIALDESSTFYAASYMALYTVDKKTAVCTEIASGTTYPNSLSFVPKGTVDPNAEALVGYEDSNYVRIDVKTGAKSTIGSLGAGALTSSGDIVSVKGGKSYLTVKGTSQCNTKDCLVEVDPATGKMTKNWGSIEHHNVFGLSFWGGKVYGFDEAGELFEVTFGTSQLATNVISIASAPAMLSFWGAGSSTSAPLVEPTK